MSRLRIIAIAVVAVMLLSAAVWALPGYLKLFMDTYKPKPNTPLAKASCLICHVSKNSPALNPYGQDLKKNLVNGKLTKASLTKVENLDSNKNGISNIQEIRAGALPGATAKRK